MIHALQTDSPERERDPFFLERPLNCRPFCQTLKEKMVKEGRRTRKDASHFNTWSEIGELEERLEAL